jgi:hypothetical protein
MRIALASAVTLSMSACGKSSNSPSHAHSSFLNKYAQEENFIKSWLDTRPPITMTFRLYCYDVNPPGTYESTMPDAPVVFAGANGGYNDSLNWRQTTYRWAYNIGYITITSTPVHALVDGTGPINWYHDCPVLTPKGQALLSGQNYILAASPKSISSWDYENEYQTDTPDRGKVKVFSARLTYTVVPKLNNIDFTAGKLQMKIDLNPDTGQWEIVESHLDDPPLTVLP